MIERGDRTTVNYKSLKVEDIKRMLIEIGYNIEGLDINGKTSWVDLHKKVSGNMEEGTVEPTVEIFGEIEEESGADLFENLDGVSFKEVEKNVPTLPHYYDPSWHDYVMSQFTPEELIDGKYPNVNALRRVVELLLGEIVDSGPIETQTSMDNMSKAVVTYEVVIEWKLDVKYDNLLDLSDKNIFTPKRFRSVASSHIGNTDDVYAVFPESIAETRAEGRALRRALRLGVVCSDELTKKDTSEFVRQQQEMKNTDGEWNENSFITDQQINSIVLLCERLKIDLDKFINSGSKSYSNIKEVSRSAAAGMLKRLNQYQCSGEDAVEVPNNLLIGEKE
jgi:hypothetical protein